MSSLIFITISQFPCFACYLITDWHQEEFIEELSNQESPFCNSVQLTTKATVSLHQLFKNGPSSLIHINAILPGYNLLSV